VSAGVLLRFGPSLRDFRDLFRFQPFIVLPHHVAHIGVLKFVDNVVLVHLFDIVRGPLTQVLLVEAVG